MFFEKRKKGIIAVFALLLTVFIAGSLVSVSAKYTSTVTAVPASPVYVQVSLRLDSNCSDATGTYQTTVLPVNGEPMPAITEGIPQRAGYRFTGYYSTDGSTGHEQTGENRFYKNDGTSNQNWDASCNVLYAGWGKVYRIDFDATTNGGTISGNTPLYAVNGDATLYFDSGAVTPNIAPQAIHNDDGMIFEGWYTAITGGTRVINPDRSIISSTPYTDASGNWDLSGNIILYAHYRANKIDFNASANGGTISSGTTPLYAKNGAATLYSDSAATTIETAPTATHATSIFDGWYTAQEGGTKVIDADGSVQAGTAYTDAGGNWQLWCDITLYAHYRVYKVTFDAGANGGSIDGNSPLYAKNGESVLYINGAATSAATIPLATHTAQRFDGWYTAQTGGEKVINTGRTIQAGTSYTDASGKWNLSGDITLYAHYVAYKVTFDPLTSGSITYGTSPLYVKYNDTAFYTTKEATSTTTSVPKASYSGENYYFSGWYTATSDGFLVIERSGVVRHSVPGYTDDSGKWIVSDDITLYARYKQYHKVTFRNMTNATGSVLTTYYELDGILYTDDTFETIVTEMPSASFDSRSGLSYWTTTNTGKVGTGDSATAAPVVVSNGAVQSGTYSDDQGHSFTINDMSHWTLNSNITLYAVWYKIDYYKDTKQIPKTAGYTELEYIESTSGGLQYLNTGVNPRDYDPFILRVGMQPTNLSEAGGIFDSLYFFGTSETSALLYRKALLSEPRAQFRFWGTGYDILHPMDEVRYNYDITYNKKSATVRRNNTFIGSESYVHPFDNTNLTFFKAGSGYSAVRLYFLTLRNGSSTLKNYIPVRNGSGILGVYDTISGGFVQNSGSGTFGANPDHEQAYLIYGEPVTILYSPSDCNYTHYKYIVVSGQEQIVQCTCDGWTYEMGIEAENYKKSISYNDIYTLINPNSVPGNVFVDLYTGTWTPIMDSAAAPAKVSTMFHDVGKDTEYVYMLPDEEDGIEAFEEEILDE